MIGDRHFALKSQEGEGIAQPFAPLKLDGTDVSNNKSNAALRYKPRDVGFARRRVPTFGATGNGSSEGFQASIPPGFCGLYVEARYDLALGVNLTFTGRDNAQVRSGVGGIEELGEDRVEYVCGFGPK